MFETSSIDPASSESFDEFLVDGGTGGENVCGSDLRELAVEKPLVKLSCELLVFGTGLVTVLWQCTRI